MLPRQERPRTSRLRILSHGLIFSLGCLTFVWGAYTFSIAQTANALGQISSGVLAGHSFRNGVLAERLRETDPDQFGKWRRPSKLQTIAVIRLRILEESIAAADQKAIDGNMDALRKAIEASLENAPADPLLWTVMFWLSNTQGGFTTDNFKYLTLSYALGPNEGWIATRRNRVALALFLQLTPELKADATREFAGLVESRLFNAAANNLIGPGWQARDSLLRGLAGVSEDNRKLFAKLVYRLGYDVDVPGVERPESRPWH
jgi:hypothetical protein